MNDTAKKLREAADYIKDYGVASVLAIVRVRDALGVGKTDTTARDLGAVLDTIADELDELDDKAARRRSHIVKLESTIAERNRELRELRKRVPSERERQILDMWPRFEDGEPVMVGDKYEDSKGNKYFAHGVRFDIDGPGLVDSEGFIDPYRNGERVKRPVQSVLDADGVEIRAGDTVWFRSLSTGDRMRKATVTGFGEHSLDGPLASVEDEAGKTWYIDPKKITHVQLDSWERLEEDAADLDDMPCDFNAKDLIRRAKALAGAEAGR